MQRVKNIIAKFGDKESKKLIKFLTETNRDQNISLLILDELVNSPQQYEQVMKIIDNKLLNQGSLKVLINGKTEEKTVKYLFNTTNDAFKYYSKIEKGKYWLAKQITEEDYVLIVFDFAVDGLVSSVQTIKKNEASDYISNLNLHNIKIND